MSALLFPAPRDMRKPWRTALAALAVVCLVLGGLYADTVMTMVGIWSRSDTFAHAFLVPPISLWLIWRQREVLARLVPRPQPWLLVPLVAAALLWLLGDLVQVNAATQLAWVSMLVLAVPAVLGLRVAHAILFPLLFLFFSVPIGEFMLPQMMDWTADFTVAALQLSGIPVYREGLQFVIPSGSWSVVEACSGVRYLIASFMVGTLFAYLNYRSTKRRVIFMLVSLAVPVVANWLRAYMIVMLGHLSGNTIAVGADHLVYGWVFFGIVIMIMFAIGARWSEPDDEPVTPTSAAVARLATQVSGCRVRPVSLAALLAAAAISLPHAVIWGLTQKEQGAAVASVELPAALALGWRSVDVPAVSFKPAFVNPADEVTRSYAVAAGEVGVYIAYYRGQHADSKLVSSVNAVVASKNRAWNLVASGSRRHERPTGGSGWRTFTVQPSAGRLAVNAPLRVWRSYWVDGRWLASDAQAKLAGAFGRLQGRGDDGAAVVVYTSQEDPAQAEAVLESFLDDNLGALESLLQSTRDKR